MAPDSSNDEESTSVGPGPEPAVPPAAPSSDPPASGPSAPEEPTPMIDIHPSTHPANTWREFFIHIATIVLGLLIAVGLEQSVEYFHHRHQASEARASIQEELIEDVSLLHKNSDRLAAEQQQLARDMVVLDSNARDTQALSALQYTWYSVRLNDAAWNAAKTNGSIALIAPREIGSANYFYLSNEAITPIILSYVTNMETATGIVDHARAVGKLNQPERDQLRTLTASAIGQARIYSLIQKAQLEALKATKLDH